MTEVFTQHGAFSWCELLTSDAEAAKQFYGKLFNWTLEPAPTAPPGVDYTLVKCAGQPVGGIMPIPAHAPGMPPHWGTYITVDDVDAIVEQAVQMGAQVCVPPQDIPQVGRFSVLQDPQGAVFSVITYFAPSA
jgi:uncharacterized protein